MKATTDASQHFNCESQQDVDTMEIEQNSGMNRIAVRLSSSPGTPPNGGSAGEECLNTLGILKFVATPDHQMVQCLNFVCLLSGRFTSRDWAYSSHH